jgi:hypothetical protein
MNYPRLPAHVALSLIAAACGKKLDGPTPTVSGLDPAAVCQAQIASVVRVKGAGLAPPVTGALGRQQVELPAVRLTLARDLDGQPASAAPVIMPDDPELPQRQHVRWTSQSAISFDVYPELMLPTGLYDVDITNPTGKSARYPASLLAVPPPSMGQLGPDLLCGVRDSSFEVTGDFFIQSPTARPTIEITSPAGVTRSYPVAGLDGCRDLPGNAGLQACTRLTVVLPADALEADTHQVRVRNPDPVACATSESVTLEITAPPVLTAVQPTAICAGSATVTLTGSGFASRAQVLVGSTAATRVTVTGGGTTAVAELPAGLPTGGPYPVTIRNAAGCESTLPAEVRVIPGPQLFFVDPPVVYNGISTQATAYGTGFGGPVQSLSLRPAAGGAALPLTFRQDPAHPGQLSITVPLGTAAGEYDLELTDGTACAALLARAVRVSDEKTLALADAPVVPAFGWAQQSTAASVFAQAAGGFSAVPRVYLNPSNPGPDTVATALSAVTFVDSAQLTALVRGLPAGKYDLIVVNPDGKVGVATAAFEVTQDPPPTVESLSPGSVANRNPETFTVRGADFRQAAVSLRCFDAASAPLASSPAATVTAASATSLDVRFDASLAGVACIVRVTNGDNATFAEFSALVITNPAQNLYAASVGPDLAVGRRGPVVLPGNASASARYLHVIGGDDASGNPLASVESAALGLLGVPTPFVTQRHRLVTPRTLAAGAQIGRFLYVVGGASGGNALASVERAAVLDPRSRGEITDLLLDPRDGQGLGAGIFYYRVAAVMGAGDPFNPGGEGLASDPFPVRLPDLGARKLAVTVQWSVVPGAVRYRVYRSPAAGATVGTEQVIGEVAAPGRELQDTGVAPIAADTPLPVGSLGVFTTLPATLSVPREGAGVAAAVDPADPGRHYLYVLGGRTDASTVLASYELLPITVAADGSQTAAASFTAGTRALGAARWQLGATAATRDVSTRIPAGSSYIYALAGVAANGTSTVSEADAALVQAGGQLGDFTSLRTMNRAGYAAVTAGDFVFAFGGGNAAPDQSIVSGEICAAGVGGCGPVATQVPPNVANWNAGQTMLTGRYLMGAALSGAFIYVVGGVTVAGSPATVTRSTEYRLW